MTLDKPSSRGRRQTAARSRRSFLAGGAGIAAGALAAASSAAASPGPSGAAMANKGPTGSGGPVTAPGGMWTHIAVLQNDVLNNQFVNWLCANPLVETKGINLRAFKDHAGSSTNRYSYAKIVNRMKAARPGLPVMLYVKPLRYAYSGTPGGGRIDQGVLDGYLDPAWLPENWPHPTLGAGGTYCGDPRNLDFQDFIVDAITTGVSTFGCDGFLADGSLIQQRFDVPKKPQPQGQPGLQVRLGDYIAYDDVLEYQDAARALFQRLKDELPMGKLALYNGLWSDGDGSSPGQLAAQVTLLPHTDGALLEYYGIQQNSNTRVNMVDYLPLMAANQDKIFMINGRGKTSDTVNRDSGEPRLRYESYEDDLLRQRYDYCSYLLAAGENHYYRYHAIFQSIANQGRTGPEDIFWDWSIDLGEPLGLYEQLTNGLYVREFENATVVVHEATPENATEPQRPGTRYFHLEREYWDPEGTHYTPSSVAAPNALRIDAGIGLILMKAAPSDERPTVDWDFRPTGNHPDVSDWQSVVASADGLQLDPVEEELQYRRDLWLDPYRFIPYGGFVPATTGDPNPVQPLPTVVEVTVKNTDPRARLMFEVEVDDLRTDAPRSLAVVVQVSTTGRSTPEVTVGPDGQPTLAPLPFRTTKQVVIKNQENGFYEDVYLYKTAVAIPTDGTVQTITIDLSEVLRTAVASDGSTPPALSARLVKHVRPITSMPTDSNPGVFTVQSVRTLVA